MISIDYLCIYFYVKYSYKIDIGSFTLRILVNKVNFLFYFNMQQVLFSILQIPIEKNSNNDKINPLIR